MDGVGGLVQHSGLMCKRPIGHASKTWQRRFFVVKDGFLLYYEEGEKKNFEKKRRISLHPKGIMPLGDCTVETVEDPVQPFTICMNNRLSEETLFVATENEADQREWMEVLTKSSRITWKNAELGDAVIRQLQMYGSRLAEERQGIYEQLHVEVQSLSEEKQRTEELERINEELSAERRKIEAVSAELSEQYAKIKDELCAKAVALASIEQEKESQNEMVRLLEQQLQALAQAKDEEAARASPSPCASPTPTEAAAASMPADAESAVTEEATLRRAKSTHSAADKGDRLRAIEEEMKKICQEKAEAELRVRQKETAARMLEDEKHMYSEEAQRLRHSLEILEGSDTLTDGLRLSDTTTDNHAIAFEKQATENELRDEIRNRLAAEDRLRAAEQALRDLEQKLGIISGPTSTPDAPVTSCEQEGSIAATSDERRSAGEGSSIITAEQKAHIRSSVKSLKTYFNHVVAEQSVEASRPIIMKNSVELRRRGLRAKSMRIPPTFELSEELGTARKATASTSAAIGDSALATKRERSATLLLRNPILRRTAIDFVASWNCGPSDGVLSDCQDSPL